MNARDEWHSLITQLEAGRDRRLRGAAATPDEERVWEDVRRRLYQMARLLAPPEDIDDVVQTVLLKLQGRDTLRRVRAARSPAGYVSVMLRNAAVDAIRRRAVHHETLEESEDATATLDSFPDVLRTRGELDALRHEISQLSDSDRLLLTLRFWEDLTIADIARRFGMPYSTIAVRLFRLLRRLRERLGSGEADHVR